MMNYRVGVILCSFYKVSTSFGKYLTVLNFQTFPFHLLCIKRPKKTNSWIDFVTMSKCLFFFHVSYCTLENSEMWTEHIKLVVSKTQLDPSVFPPISFSFFEYLSTAYVSANLPYLSVIAYWVGWAKHGAKAEFSLRF